MFYRSLTLGKPYWNADKESLSTSFLTELSTESHEIGSSNRHSTAVDESQIPSWKDLVEMDASSSTSSRLPSGHGESKEKEEEEEEEIVGAMLSFETSSHIVENEKGKGKQKGVVRFAMDENREN